MSSTRLRGNRPASGRPSDRPCGSRPRAGLRPGGRRALTHRVDPRSDDDPGRSAARHPRHPGDHHAGTRRPETARDDVPHVRRTRPARIRPARTCFQRHHHDRAPPPRGTRHLGCHRRRGPPHRREGPRHGHRVPHRSTPPGRRGPHRQSHPAVEHPAESRGRPAPRHARSRHRDRGLHAGHRIRSRHPAHEIRHRTAPVHWIAECPPSGGDRHRSVPLPARGCLPQSGPLRGGRRAPHPCHGRNRSRWSSRVRRREPFSHVSH